MRRPEIIKRLEEKARELGIPPHVLGIAKVTSSVELNVVAGPENKTIRLRSGATSLEVETELRRLEVWWANRQAQIDLEELTTK